VLKRNDILQKKQKFNRLKVSHLPPFVTPLFDVAVQVAVPAGHNPGGMVSTILAPVVLDMNTTVTSKLKGAFCSTLVGPDFVIKNGDWRKESAAKQQSSDEHNTASTSSRSLHSTACRL
jgi:hypothetical protein